MVLDFKTIGNLYYHICEERQRIDLNMYSRDLADTIKYVLDATDSGIIEEHGRDHILYGLACIFEEILSVKDTIKYSRLFLTIPEDVMSMLISTNQVVNRKDIEEGITPKEYFMRPESGNVDYFK